MKKKLILGLGTGRCGTLFLFDFLSNQKNVFFTNEAVRWGWYSKNTIDKKIYPIDVWLKSEKKIVGDIGSFTLPHVTKINKIFSDIKLIVLQRNLEQTVKSWIKWTNVKHNFWVPHKNGIWEDDIYDDLFPKFNLEKCSKEDAIKAYYHFYYATCKKLEKKFQIFWLKTEDLNNIETKKSILSYCQIDKDDWNLDANCRKNSSC